MIRYIERTKHYYRAQGFEQDYQWAMNAETPFNPPAVPLKTARITLVTTAVVEPNIPKPIRTAKSYPFSEVPAHFDTADVSWDKVTTHTNDRESYFPLQALNARIAAGDIGSLAPRFHFIPTEYSQRHTRDQDAPLSTQHCLDDEVDLAILIPLWPVCHQTVSLAARSLETAGIATVVIGSALDILQRAGTPRIVFNDLPLGNPVGKPFDRVMQDQTLTAALELLYQAQSPSIVRQLPHQWSESESWRENFMAITPFKREQLLSLGDENRRQRQHNREQGLFRA